MSIIFEDIPAHLLHAVPVKLIAEQLNKDIEEEKEYLEELENMADEALNYKGALAIANRKTRKQTCLGCLAKLETIRYLENRVLKAEKELTELEENS